MRTDSEIIVSTQHIDPKEFDGYVVYKLGNIRPVRQGKREASMLWSNAKSTSHIEGSRITNLASRVVNVVFNTPFASIPSGWIKVYRMKQISVGKWKQYDVLYYHTTENWKTTEGFSLQIDATEALAGIVVEYEFK